MTAKKIISLDKISKLSEKLKNSGKKIILCHGVFDLLHIGHLRHFTESKAYGDVLGAQFPVDKSILQLFAKTAFTPILLNVWFSFNG